MKKYIILLPVFLISILFSFTPDIRASETSMPVDSIYSLPFMENFQGFGTERIDTSRDFKIPETSMLNYSTGSMAYADRKPLLVVIDPGHGGEDPGSNSGKLFEKNLTLDICIRINSILKRSGITTYMTREKDEYIDRRERIAIANREKAALYLSVHCDWFKDSSYSGTSTLYYPSKSLSEGNLSEMEYARIVQTGLMKVLKTNNRNIIDRSNLSVLKRAEMPSVIVELAFLSNNEDARRLSSEAFRQKAAEALASAVMKALDKIK